MYYWHLEAIYVPFNGLKISSKNYNQQILFGAQIVEVGRAAFCNSAWAQTDRRKTVSLAHLVPENWCNDILFWCSAFSLPSTGTFTFLFNNQKTSLSQVKSKGKTAIPTWCSAISYPIHKHLLRVMNELPCNWPLHITSDVPGLLFPTLQVKHIPGIYSKPITPNLPYLVLLRIKNILFVFSILYFSARHTKS